MSAWMPIETAPKDGTRIQLMRVIDAKRWPALPAIGWIKVGSWRKHYLDGYEEGWREHSVPGFIHQERLKITPTHWQPLPQPPEET